MTLRVQSMPRQGVLVLSNNSATPYEVPADMVTIFPDDATCYIRFIDTNGDQVGPNIAGTVYPDRCQWLLMPADVDQMKRGYNFEAFMVTADNVPFKLRYGKVVRREATFEYAVTATQQKLALLYDDNFSNRTGQPGNQYAQVSGNTTIHDNSGFAGIGATGNGLGVDIGALYQTSACRINRAINGDSVRMAATIVIPYGFTNGKTVIGICGNTGLTSGLGIQLDSQAKKSELVEVTGPTADDINPLTSQIADTPANFDSYTLDYNDQTHLFKVFKNGSTVPLLSWTDANDQVVHGQGYRYPFFCFNATLLGTGPQINKWEIQDYVGGGA